MTTRDHAELYRGENGDWYSRVISANGNTIFDGSEGYRNREDCAEMVRTRFGPIPIEYTEAPTD
jgi:uncharacterized protein YegP (UPF0339 family)